MVLFKKFLQHQEGFRSDQELLDIVSNLRNILNTRRGYGSFLRDFGVDDMNEYYSRDQIALAVIREVQESVEKYEPRVQLLKISRIEDDDPQRLSFRIECRLSDTTQSIQLEFDSLYNTFSLEQGS